MRWWKEFNAPKSEFGVRNSRAKLLVDRPVKAPYHRMFRRGAEPGGMIYRAPFLNVTTVGNYRLDNPMPWHFLKLFHLI